MTIALDPRFPCVSPASISPELLPKCVIVDELQREHRLRLTTYPRRVDKGRMSQMDADWETGAMRAIADDLACDLMPLGTDEHRAACRRAGEALRPFGWHGAIACLRREILLRRQCYPRWIDKGTLEPDAARHQLERIEAAHVHYWGYCRHFWLAELGPWQPTWWDAQLRGEALARWIDGLRAHRARFLPGADNHRCLYRPEDKPASSGADPAQPELAIA